MRGQTLLEFALVVPVFFMLVFAIVDFGHLFYLEMTLQNAVQDAGRFAATGNHLKDANNNTLSRVNSIIQTAQQAAPGIDFSSINISSQYGGKGSAGGPGDIVTVSFATVKQFFTPLIGKFFPGGVYNFTVSVTFKNEPFPAANTN